MKKITIWMILLGTMMLAGCGTGGDSQPVIQSTTAATQSSAQQTHAEARTIAPEAAKDLIGTDGVVLLDVRTQEEYDEAHIDGALLVPYDAIEAHLDKLPKDKNTTIILYCRSGRRSAIAAQTLSGMGYTAVFDLGGIQSWPYDTVAG